MPDPRFLRLRTVRDAVMVPRPDHTDKTVGAGVVRRSDGGLVVVADTGVRRRGRQYVKPPPTTGVEPTRRIDAAVYGGFVYEHYGHFMLESIGRLWFAGVDRGAPIAWIPATGDRFTPWMSDMLDLLGFAGERIIVDGATGPLEVGELLVGDQGFEVQRYLHPWLLSRLAVRDAAPDPNGSRLWLSRSGLGDLGGVDEERAIEDRLRQEGWTIVHLERHSLVEQVDLLARATSIAGIEGSAFHTLLFVSGYRGTIDLLTRHHSTNFEVIAAATGWDQVRHPLPGGTPTEWWRPNGSRDVRWSGVDVDAAVRTITRSAHRRSGRLGLRQRWAPRRSRAASSAAGRRVP